MKLILFIAGLFIVLLAWNNWQLEKRVKCLEDYVKITQEKENEGEQKISR